jgi:site-specific DNA-methyltransferase (adenine-specific)
MDIKTMRISDLKPDPNNARTHDARNIEAIKVSLEKFSQRKPIVITPEGVVLAGNGTLEAAKALGWSEITVALTPSDWDYATAKAYALADNRSAELAEWDTSVLASQLVELDAEGWDIGELGFDVPEQETDTTLEDDGPLQFDEAEPAITKLGDIYQLGRHRLICGDSMDANTQAKLMNGKPFESIVTDPPYGMAFVSNHRNTKHKAIENDTTVDALVYTCNLEALHSKYIFCRWDNLAEVPKPTSLITWVKNNWSMGDLEHSHARQTEVALFYPGVNHSFPNGRPNDVVNHARTNNELHPTQKPVELMAEVIGWTKGIIFDPFSGSGETIMAAEQLGRTCYGIELDPKYCDVIVKRWENLTGKKAELCK